jgi:hypothetical protein
MLSKLPTTLEQQMNRERVLNWLIAYFNRLSVTAALYGDTGDSSGQNLCGAASQPKRCLSVGKSVTGPRYTVFNA